MNIQLPDFTKLHWQLNVALLGAIFSIFSLVFNENYIVYGFLTFVFGVVGTSILPALEQWRPEKKWRDYLVVQSLLTGIWFIACLLIYIK